MLTVRKVGNGIDGLAIHLQRLSDCIFESRIQKQYAVHLGEWAMDNADSVGSLTNYRSHCAFSGPEMVITHQNAHA